MFSRCSFSEESRLRQLTSLFFVDFFFVNVFDLDVGEAWENIQGVFITHCVGVLLQELGVSQGGSKPKGLLEGSVGTHLLRVKC